MATFTDHQLLAKLCKAEGCTALELHRRTMEECMGPGIYRSCGEFSDDDVEPDQREGYCEACGEQGVASSLELAGLI